MKVFALIFTVIIYSLNVYSQNLIKNGSFEELNVPCLTSISLYTPSTEIKDILAFKGTPDFYNECVNVTASANYIYQVDIPQNFLSYQWARTSQGMAGYINILYQYLNNKIGEEILTMILSDSLIPNKKYCMRFFTVLSNRVGYATDAIGAALSSEFHMNNPDQMSYYSSISNFGKGFITDTLNWIPVFDTIVATGSELYVHIGRFHHVDSSNITTVSTQTTPSSFPFYYHLYYYIDDVALWPCDTIPPIANAGNDTTICKGDSAYIGGHNYSDYYYSWSDGNTLLQRDEHKGKIWIKPQQSKWFYVTATDFKYDKTVDSVFVTVKICGNDTVGIGTSTPLSVPSINVYPNPANDNFIIDIFGLDENEINFELWSVDGRFIKGGIISNNYKNKVNISQINNGIYYIKLFNNKKLLKNEIIIKKYNN